MGPILIFDKSFLQGLSEDESVWLDCHYLSNITPLFFIETLADLEKEVRKGRTPEQVVGSLAAKTPDLTGRPNVHHHSMLAGELSGAGDVPMGQGQIIVSGGTPTQLEGQRGVVFPQAPEEEALNRWQRGEFLDLERQLAKRWRQGLALLDPVKAREQFAPWFGGRVPKTLADVKAEADRFIDGSDQEDSLRFGMTLLGVAPDRQEAVIARWQAGGSPPISTFAPYFRQVFGVELFFYLGLAARLISERRTNKVDIAYLYYLPFCMVFTSSDKLHAATVPLFLRPNQSFVPGAEMKTDLGALDRYYDALPEDTKVRGLYHFANRPPADGGFLVTRLWDKHMSPTWRDHAKARPEPPDRERDGVLLERIREQVDAAKHARLPPDPLNVDAPDYLIITRKVRLTKGRWRRFPPEVQPDP